MLLQDTIDGISAKISEIFGDGYEVYVHEPESEQRVPAFLIQPQKLTQVQQLGSRFFREQRFSIQYFPRTERYHKEIYSAMEMLMMNIDYINVAGNLVRGTDLSVEKQDGILQLCVSYNMFIDKQAPEAEIMEQAQVDTILREL